MTDYEKLGSFYLGRLFDPESSSTTDTPLLYDARDLTTHAVCVGMTGSGKTGLCIGLLEEAAIDGIPALVIDPKGDLGNLMLQFPDLKPSDFEPWLEPSEADRKGLSISALAEKTAETWRNGLAAWDQSPERINRLRKAAEVAIYTPGSTAGRPLTVLRSFSAPAADTVQDPTTFRDHILTSVSGLLALVGINGDPMRSREHILLSSILDHHWRLGQDLDIPSLIREIQKPPFTKVGVFDLETFYPSAGRLELAMALNNLVASPGFSVWTEGEPLDIQRLLYTPDGKPRVAVLSIAHLGESERMFFVTILLNAVLAWMRSQSGTSSLRALLYMDEIFGYFPPSANPPSKLPMLTLLKQARAYGLGVVLATQNPVDLDYKGLANTGTWLIGRLQTERDKARVLDGLESASSTADEGFSRQEIDRLLSGLGGRVFLLHNVHRGAPVLFQTRWALSFLRGPLTLTQIKSLARKPDQHVNIPAPADIFAKTANRTDPGRVSAPMAPEPSAISSSSHRSTAPLGIDEYFLRPREAGARVTGYEPLLFSEVRLHFVDTKAKVDCWQSAQLIHDAVHHGSDLDWKNAECAMQELAAYDGQPADGLAFAPLPDGMARPSEYAAWKKMLLAHIYQNITLELYACHELKMASTTSESEGDFRARIDVVLRERRDREMDKIRRTYASKLRVAQERLRKEQARLDKQQELYGQQKMNTVISLGSTILGALLGRSTVSATTIGRAATTMRGATRTTAKKVDVEQARENIAAAAGKCQQIEDELETLLEQVRAHNDSASIEISRIDIRPRKTDITVSAFGIAWMPI